VRTEPGPNDGEVWNAGNVEQYPNGERADHRPSVPYVWLGTETRGLAWFADNEAGSVTDFDRPLQRIVRRDGTVVLEIDVVQKPFTFTAPRTIVFGLMASPGKPFEPGFRTRPVAHGIGPVSCWGGWQCASKYPTERDYAIVDKVQEARATGKVDTAWFEARAKQAAEAWPGRKINDGAEWLPLTLHFAQLAAGSRGAAAGTYFEEHFTDWKTPEWQVFQDEWAAAEFHRFAPRWGAAVFAPSYQDFACWHANEWMKRGVSLYFDNAYPKRCYQTIDGAGFRDDAGRLRYGTTMFAQRACYRRIWKLAQEWNRRGGKWPIDVTLHMTNTQTLPFNTWATATLDLEQLAHTADPAAGPAEVEGQKGGFQMPWPPDYTRIVTAGRQAGAVPLALDFVSGNLRHAALPGDARVAGPRRARGRKAARPEMAWFHRSTVVTRGSPFASILRERLVEIQKHTRGERPHRGVLRGCPLRQARWLFAVARRHLAGIRPAFREPLPLGGDEGEQLLQLIVGRRAARAEQEGVVPAAGIVASPFFKRPQGQGPRRLHEHRLVEAGERGQGRVRP
jgi:hypothetical protein